MGGYCEHGNEPGQITLDTVGLEANSAVLKKTSILLWDISGVSLVMPPPSSG
jgi:hypothetical protein